MAARKAFVRRGWTGHRIGESHPRARLSDEDVRLVRALHQEGLGYRQIAGKFEAGVSTIRDICTHRTRYDV